ncbi:alpha/beta hydrolase [Thiococcus pfennigii]|nr:alpha/beta hydrolase [Thiococcus pfennigii]
MCHRDRKARWCLVMLAALALAACSDGVLRYELAPGEAGARRVIVPSKARDGQVVVSQGNARGTAGCRLDYLLYSPSAARRDADTLVVVGHGFLRSYEQMDGLSRRIAAAGLRTASVRFCNSRIWDGRHRQNGQDMNALADALGARRVVYVGFSAGGLAALVAGRGDERTVGVVALDLVDRDGLGVAAAADLDRPLIALVGPPSPCNAENNGLTALAAARRAKIHRIPDATHCDFEAPTDWLCRRVCGERPGGEQRREQIITAATDAVVALTR